MYALKINPFRHKYLTFEVISALLEVFIKLALKIARILIGYLLPEEVHG